MSDYVLSDREVSEIGRLVLQHEVWRSESEELPDRCAIAAGSRVLDLGCGPGFLTLDLFRCVGPTGRVTAVDASARFTDHLRQPSEEFDRVYGAVARLIRDAGGDPDIGGRLPDLLAAAGFEDVDRREIRRSNVPGSPLWEWIVRTGENHGNLVERGLVGAAELESYYAVMGERERMGSGRFVAPTLQVIFGRKS